MYRNESIIRQALLVMNMSAHLNIFPSCFPTCGIPSCSLSSPSSYCTSGNHVRASALFKASGSSPFMPCCEKAQIRAPCFHSPSFKGDIKSISGRMAGLGNTLCFMKRGCGVHAHTYRGFGLTDQSLTSKNNKPALSQDPRCRVSQQMRSICGRCCMCRCSACMPQRQILFPSTFVSVFRTGKRKQGTGWRKFGYRRRSELTLKMLK